MIVTLTDVTTNEVAQRLERLRIEGGAIALGRVLTLVIVLGGTDRLDEAIAAADAASMEHPCRVLALCELAHADPHPGGGVDAEIRVGGDAGASETVIVTIAADETRDLDALLNPLLLPDAPIVAWWPGEAPEQPARDPIGAMATRRIIDTYACADPIAAMRRAASGYQAGDTDISWTRITLWRAQLAAAFEGVDDVSVERAQVRGNPRHPSCHLLLGWLATSLRCEAVLEPDDEASAVVAASIEWAGGRILLERPEGADVAVLRIADELPHEVALQLRTLPECLAEELRRLDPDEVYGQLVRHSAQQQGATP